ncbi:ABC transporter permease [uncultured Parabacteroides sp.]|uniref:ABC transporter permease n=1 Tax=uncultured Parabacteroides sp. TaxID=512312 RepID=UPI00262AB0D4|nr:ABC transporter permease [uncultured Parabacteroides sp.]
MQNLKNLFLSPKGHQMIFVSNVFCLSIAFAAFVLLMFQIRYEWGYDGFHKDGDRIFRLEIRLADKGAGVLFARPMIDEFLKSSSMVEIGAPIRGYIGKISFDIKKGEDKFSYIESIREIYPQYLKLFNFEVVEGDLSAMAPNSWAIPESMAKKLFGDESAINQSIVAGDDLLTVAAVYKDFPENSVVKNMIYSILPETRDVGEWMNLNYQLFVKLTDAKVGDEILANFKKTFKDENYDWSRGELFFTNISDIYFETDTNFDSHTEKGSRAILYTLIGIAFLILVIAAINFMNYCIAVVPVRIKSINVQKVLGRSDRSLRLAILKEILVVTMLAYLLSMLWVFMVSDSAIADLIKPDISLSANWHFVVKLFFIPLTIAFLAGLYPSLYATSFSPALVLKGSFALSPTGRMFRNWMVGFQFAASFVLFMASFFIFLQNKFMKNGSLGFDKDLIVIVELDQNLNKRLSVLKEKWMEFSSIKNISFTSVLFCGSDYYSGRFAVHKENEIQFQAMWVDYDFPEVMGIPITEGRTFRKEDKLQLTETFLFNDIACKKYSLNTNDHLKMGDQDGVIAGFMPDIKYRSFRNVTEPMAFILSRRDENSSSQYAYVRVQEGVMIDKAIADIRKGIKMIDPSSEVNVYPFNYVLDNTYKIETSLNLMISLFSLVSILISFFGVIGIVVFDSQYKRKEVSLRKIHGATTISIIERFNAAYFRILLLSFVLAVPITVYGMLYWLQNFAYKISLDWWVFVVVFLIISSITAFIVTTLTWRVANLNPVENLKTE